MCLSFPIGPGGKRVLLVCRSIVRLWWSVHVDGLTLRLGSVEINLSGKQPFSKGLGCFWSPEAAADARLSPFGSRFSVDGAGTGIPRCSAPKICR